MGWRSATASPASRPSAASYATYPNAQAPSRVALSTSFSTGTTSLADLAASTRWGDEKTRPVPRMTSSNLAQGTPALGVVVPAFTNSSSQRHRCSLAAP